MEGELPLTAREGLKIREEGELSGTVVKNQGVVVAGKGEWLLRCV
jgi:hypothetical protein